MSERQRLRSRGRGPGRHALRGLAVLLVCGAALHLFGGARHPAEAQPSRASALVAEVNAYRANLGLPTLEAHPSLMAAAQAHAEWMAANYTYSHQGAGGSMPGDRARAAGYPVGSVYENVEGGTSLSPAEAVVWWDKSGVHQMTMRLPDHVHIGAGYAENDDQQLYVLLIGKPQAVTASASRTSGAGAAAAAPTDEPGPIAVPVTRSEPREDGSIVHVLQQGQSLWDVSAVYGVPLDELLQLNGLRRGAVLFPGMEIIVKLGQGLVPTPQLVHVVQEGETPWTIAALHGLTLDELLDLNGLKRGDVVKVGDALYIRDLDPTPTEVVLPSATPTVEETATPLPPLGPTITPLPSETPLPSDTPLPSNTPPPTTTRTPTPTVTPLAQFSPSPTAATAVALAADAPPAARAADEEAAAPPADDSTDAVLIAAMIAIAGLGLLLAVGGVVLVLRSR